MKELRNEIAASLFMIPCTIDELMTRDFLKNRSRWGVDQLIRDLERVEAIFYRGEIMHIKKAWAKSNLKEYDFDFRTEKQKKIDRLSSFQKSLYKAGLIDL